VIRRLALAALSASILLACAAEDATSPATSTGAGGAGGAHASGGAGGEAATLPIPFEPAKPKRPAIDAPYLQETNHTSNEVEAGIGPLVAVVIPPAGIAGLDAVTQVTARGIVRHVDGKAVTSTIPGGDPDLVAAAATAGAIVLGGPGALYVVGADGALAKIDAPAGVTIKGLAGGAGAVHVRTSAGLGRFVPGEGPTWPGGGAAIDAVTESATHVLVATGGELAAHALPAPLPLGAPAWTAKVGAVAALVADVTLPRKLDVVVVRPADAGIAGLVVGADGAPSIADVPEFAPNRVPLADPRAAARTSDGGLVVATAAGAMRVVDRGDGPEWRVYGAERWLPSEDVRGVATDASVADGPLHFATAGGLATVTAKRITLEEKLAAFVERVAKRHDRDGAVADSHLESKGDLATNIPWDSDNDGSWTSYWLLAECFRWKVTAAADAKAHFDRSLEAMLRLRDVTGTSFFVARSVIRKAGCQLDDCDGPDDGMWFTSPDGQWWVKDDTSNDEVIAHVFMMGHAYDLCADEPQKQRIRDHVAGIVGGIVDHGYKLFRHDDSQETTYGQLDPAYVHGIAGQVADGGVRAAEMLAALDLAHHLTGEDRFLDAKRSLVTDHQYDEAAESMWDHPLLQGDDDLHEMGTEAWFSLLRYETDPALRAKWQRGWQKVHAGTFRDQQAAWWDLVDAVVGEPRDDFDAALRWLRLAPVDMIRWDLHGSQRRDLVPAPKPAKKGSWRSDGRIVPYDERPCDRWNTSQYKIDGGFGGVIEMDGADVLASYWMGRYYGLIVPGK
jgi:hypothetical protein